MFDPDEYQVNLKINEAILLRDRSRGNLIKQLLFCFVPMGIVDIIIFHFFGFFGLTFFLLVIWFPLDYFLKKIKCNQCGADLKSKVHKKSVYLVCESCKFANKTYETVE